MGGFEVDADIRRAWTISSRVYTCPEVFEAQRERVFAPSWQFIGDLEMIKAPGSVHPFTLLEGCLSEPLLLARDMNDEVHLVSNVCTHRGSLVCEGPGVARSLRCRYHGRKFGLDGKFQFMPEFSGAEGFPSPADDLPAVSLSRWGGLLFGSLEPDRPFREEYGPMLERLGWLPLHAFRYDPSRRKEYLVRANWALYVENYLEGFHIPYIHAALNEAIDYGTYDVETFPGGVLQLARAKGTEDYFDLPATSADSGQRIAAYYYWLFPNMMYNFYPWGLSINVVCPIGLDRTKVTFLPYVWDPSRLDQGAGGDLDRVEREDEAVVEMVQVGVRSRFYDRGRYSPDREPGTHHFHRLLAEALG